MNIQSKTTSKCTEIRLLLTIYLSHFLDHCKTNVWHHNFGSTKITNQKDTFMFPRWWFHLPWGNGWNHQLVLTSLVLIGFEFQVLKEMLRRWIAYLCSRRDFSSGPLIVKRRWLSQRHIFRTLVNQNGNGKWTKKYICMMWCIYILFPTTNEYGNLVDFPASHASFVLIHFFWHEQSSIDIYIYIWYIHIYIAYLMVQWWF